MGLDKPQIALDTLFTSVLNVLDSYYLLVVVLRRCSRRSMTGINLLTTAAPETQLALDSVMDGRDVAADDEASLRQALETRSLSVRELSRPQLQRACRAYGLRGRSRPSPQLRSMLALFLKMKTVRLDPGGTLQRARACTHTRSSHGTYAPPALLLSLISTKSR